MSVLVSKAPDRRTEFSLPSFAKVTGAVVLVAGFVFVGTRFPGSSDVPELGHKQADSLRADAKRRVVQINRTPASSTLVVDDMVFYAPKSPPAVPDNTRAILIGPIQAVAGLTEEPQRKGNGENKIPAKEKKPDASFAAVLPRKEETNPRPRTLSGEPPVPGTD